jgi:hypothetical protein
MHRISLSSGTTAKGIADHVWDDENKRRQWEELGINSKEELADYIDEILNNTDESARLPHGRMGYFDRTNGLIVILDPNNLDGGTIIDPAASGRDPEEYWENKMNA